MKNLPACKFRGRIIDDKMVECSCPSLLHRVEGQANIATCLYPCPYSDEPVAVAKRESPKLFTKAINFFTSLARHAIAGFPVVTPEQYKTRLTICMECEARHPTQLECTECGCPIEEKIAWAKEFCPLKKWMEENVKEGAKGRSGCGSCGHSK